MAVSSLNPTRRQRAEAAVAGRLHQLVLTEQEEEARFRRRFKLHMFMWLTLAVITAGGAWTWFDSSVLIGSTFMVNTCSEYLDYIGKF